MLRVSKTRGVRRFARHEGLSDAALRMTVERARKGLIDADLGGGLIKQRVHAPAKADRPDSA
ncbi:type II toxin-antitoxin system RelE/ParE family toxin [Bordetella genomosp. 13]|uniref:type II toxin-antitoxin system RelE/ParE family toxin n=1 Tax=Bordetella genomosp. 13 TaxID=463040 RepID=UPI001C92D385